MKILSVYDKEFARYGHVITGYDVAELMETLDSISPLPEMGTEYVPGNPVLEALPVAKQFAVNEYGGMPIQLGWCNGHNTKMNCLEYHRDSEVNLGTKDFILLLAKIDDIEDGKLDSAKVKAFLCPAGVPVCSAPRFITHHAMRPRGRASRCSSSCRRERTDPNPK